MAEIESKAIHIQLTSDEARDGKKKMLEIEMNVLNIMNHFKEFKALDKEEGKYRQELRRGIKGINEAFDQITEALPKEEPDARPIYKVKHERFEVNAKGRPQKEDKIKSELEQIKERLKKLE